MAIETSTAQETIATLRRFAANAPTYSGSTVEDLLGWWTTDGVYLCSPCADRIIARGCSIPKGSEACWTGEPYGVCCVCGK